MKTLHNVFSKDAFKAFWNNVKKFKFFSFKLVVVIVSVVMFTMFYKVDNAIYSTQVDNVKTYATYLAYPIWELDQKNTEQYIEAISHTERYKNVTVELPDVGEFVHYQQLETKGYFPQLRKFFEREVPFRYDIEHNQQYIARVNVTWIDTSNYLYFLTFVLVLLTFILLGALIAKERRDIKKYSKQKAINDRQRFIDTIPNGVVRLNLHGQIETFNDAYQKMVGYGEEYIRGKSLIFANFIQEQRFSEKLIELREKRPDPTPMFFDTKCLDGRILTIQMDWNYTRDPNKEINGFICQLTDITEQLKNEKKLEDAKSLAEHANQLKTEFLVNISHELRTPMNGIISFASLGLKRAEALTPDKIKHYFKTIFDSSNRLLNLINELLDLSKLEAGKMRFEFHHLKVRPIIEEVIVEMSVILADKKIEVAIDPDFPSVSVYIDRERIGQVIRNILYNSVKFSPENSTIDVLFSVIEEHDTAEAKKWLKVSIADNGVGIPEEEKEQIFDKFVQSSKTKTGAGGTGLGLAICKEIVEGHQGKIWVENKESGQGAMFSFTLPYERYET